VRPKWRLKARLSAAFQATPHLTDTDLTLFAILHSWTGNAARPWLSRKLEAAAPEGAGIGLEGLASLAEELDDDTLRGYVQAANEDIRQYAASLGAWTEETDPLVDRKIAAVEKELRLRFAKALGAGR
jgi:hypothetical protein